jgi:hypothetical protein
MSLVVTPVTTINAREGMGGTVDSGGPITWATFTDTDPNANNSTAVIDWGDGTTPQTLLPGNLIPNGSGGFDVRFDHTYADEGVYNATVTVTDTLGISATVTDKVTVADFDLHPMGAATIAGTVGTAINAANIVTFTDGNPIAKASDFSATIDWGDFTSLSPGTVAATPTGPGFAGPGFAVSGPAHTYGAAGSYLATVTIIDDGGSLIRESFEV